jgi:hypothetical protein
MKSFTFVQIEVRRYLRHRILQCSFPNMFCWRDFVHDKELGKIWRPLIVCKNKRPKIWRPFKFIVVKKQTSLGETVPLGSSVMSISLITYIHIHVGSGVGFDSPAFWRRGNPPVNLFIYLWSTRNNQVEFNPISQGIRLECIASLPGLCRTSTYSHVPGGRSPGSQ